MFKKDILTKLIQKSKSDYNNKNEQDVSNEMHLVKRNVSFHGVYV